MFSLSFKIIIITCCWILNVCVIFVLSSNIVENGLCVRIFFPLALLLPPSSSWSFFFDACVCTTLLLVNRFSLFFSPLQHVDDDDIDHKYLLAYLHSHSHVIKTERERGRKKAKRRKTLFFCLDVSMIFREK